MKKKFLITGMSCAACSARVDKAVRKVTGVKDVNVNLLTNSMVVNYLNESCEKNIISAVKDAGYGVITNDKIDETKINSNSKEMIIRLILSFVFLIPLFYLSMGFMLSWPIGSLNQNIIELAIIELILSLIIMIINNSYYKKGVKSLLKGSPNMDTLVAFGSGVAFIYSLIILIFNLSAKSTENYLALGIDYNTHINSLRHIMMNISFETAGMVPAFITIGKTLESISKGRTTSAIKSLMLLSPKTVNILENEKEKNIPIEEAKIGDIFIVKPGENIPLDGKIIKGETSVDESSLTGESLPIDKSVGEDIRSGTINISNPIYCRAIKVGKDTTINQIISLVEEASNSKAKISSIADKISGIFVPTVLIISLIIFAVWLIFGTSFLLSHPDIESTLLSYSFERAISVLVISCPCALGLATPVAIMVGNGKAAKNGILFKNAIALENAKNIKYLVLDKTGTITQGKPEVIEVIKKVKRDYLSEIYSLENNSNHPISIAIKNYAAKKVTPLKEVNYINHIKGKGIEGKISDEIYFVGNERLIKERVGISFDKEVSLYQDQGKIVIAIANEKEILSYFIIADKIRDDSIEAISRIKNMGIIPLIITGDNEKTAKYIAEKVGLDYYFAEALPQDKSTIISLLKKDGKVMMVGDGINDAISLTTSDIGVAIGKGSDIAIESADVILMKSSLMDIVGAINLSKRVVLNIKENLFWAFFYNIIMIPFAAGAFSFIGIYHLLPWMGSACMAISSTFVVLNSLRINYINIYKNERYKKSANYNYLDNIKNNFLEEKEMKEVIKIGGMMCMHCVKHVEEAIKKVEGVTNVEVSLDKNEATVTGTFKKQEVIKAINNAGYKA